jgi:hypothetical protein
MESFVGNFRLCTEPQAKQVNLNYSDVKNNFRRTSKNRHQNQTADYCCPAR